MPKFEEIAHKGRCDVCGKQTDVAVCASSCGPISLAYCRSCLEAGLCGRYSLSPEQSKEIAQIVAEV